MTTRGAINSEKQPDRLRLHLYNGWDKGGQRLEFYIFDAAYVKRLAEGDPATESHFSVYFGKFIVLKLRARRLSPSLAEDVQQETMFRVLKALRQGSGVTQPERFGAFVNSVCNNVVLEFLHKESRHPSAPENSPEPADDRVDMDAVSYTHLDVYKRQSVPFEVRIPRSSFFARNRLAIQKPMNR